MPASSDTLTRRLFEIEADMSAEPKVGTTSQRLYDLASRIHREAMVAHRRGQEDKAALFLEVAARLRRQADAEAA